MSSIRRGILFSAADKYASQILSLVTLAIMSRILTPAETGLYLIANSLILLADNFRAFGVGIYIVQERELDRQAVRAGFTVTLVISYGIGLAIWLSAELLAAFYDNGEIAHLLRLAALAFAAIPFGAPILALLQRDLAFPTLAGLNVTAGFVGFLVTIGLGFAGTGPASYVWGYVATSVTVAVLAFALRPEPWIYRPTLAGSRRVLAFGMTCSAVTLLNMAYEMLPRLAFGKILGFAAVGLYGRAQTVCQLPDRVIASALHPVVLPAMAAEVRAERDLKPAYLRGLTLMSSVQWPALILLALLADPVVRLLLGAQWTEAAPLVRIVALGNMVLAPAFLTFPVLVATGRIRDTLTSSLISLPPAAAITIGSAQFGLTAVACSIFVTAPLMMFVSLVFVRRAIGLGWGEILRSLRPSLGVAAATAAVPACVVLLSPNSLDLQWGEAALAFAGGVAGGLIALLAGHHPAREELLTVARMASRFLSRTRISRSET
ncbi:oligosaccharide flippase family protein [Cereibacter sphaeroides]|uniref:oligosaccharide flippase family protein n=1 Tax=Cereibacter sphaeroides TaxID=1063 RepID=UPI00313A89AC